MARAVVLGNSGLTVALNESGLVHDFYYPYVGLENLTTARMTPHKIGLWIDGNFSWIDSDEWDVHVDFEDRALVSNVTAKHKNNDIELIFQDFVDCAYDIFARKIKIVNNSSKKIEIRLFFHQVFQISALGRADTAMYVPGGHYMLDYKGRCTLLAYVEIADGEPFDQYAAGNAGIEGKEGTFKDAEDGELSMSAVEHGGVDSTIRLRTFIEPMSEKNAHYWLAVADSQQRLEFLHKEMLGAGFNQRMHATYQHWHDWLQKSDEVTENMSTRYATAVRKSLMVIKAHVDEHGGVIASCDSSIYNYGRDYYSYVWPRDGAYAMWPLIKLGYKHEPKAFFEFCKSILHPDGYLMHKYQPDRAIGSTWHPLVHGKRKELAIQEDETAIVVYMLCQYVHKNSDDQFMDHMYESFVKPACNFMTRFIDVETGLPHASYDLWEEKFLSSTYTTAVVYRALVDAAEYARLRGEVADWSLWSKTAQSIREHSHAYYNEETESLIKGFHYDFDKTYIDKTLDVSSAYAAWTFNFGTKQQIAHTVGRIERELLNISPSNGVARYEYDNYFKSDPAYKGNPWFVTTLWMGQFYAMIGKTDETKKIIDWALDHGVSSGVLSEQINPENGLIISVTPLVWSHAELINTILLT